MFETPEAMQAAVDDYFTKKTKDKKPFTVCGMSLHLGFASRQSLFEYGRKPKFTDIVKAAKSRIEEQLEENLHSSGCTGTIFNLKANFGWRDQFVEVTGKDGKDLVPEMPVDEAGRRLAFIFAQALNEKPKSEPKTGEDSDD